MMDTMVFIDANGDQWRFQYYNGLFYGTNWDKLDDHVLMDTIPSDMVSIEDSTNDAIAHQAVSSEINS